MSFSFSYLSDVGRKRKLNEDYLEFDDALGLYIVCDGMGGHQGGDVASKLAARTLKSSLLANKYIKTLVSRKTGPQERKAITAVLSQAIAVANKTVYEYSIDMNAEKQKKAGMGTTLVMALKTLNGIFIAHIGDSRAYLVRGENVIQLTEDHSYVNELLHMGQIGPAEAEDHPQKNVITRALGIGAIAYPEIMFYEIMDKDFMVLCTDGLHGYFSDYEFLRYHQAYSIEDVSKSMVDHALAGGGKDNITLISMQWGGEESPPVHPHDITIQNKIDTLKKINLFKALNYKEITQLIEVIHITHVNPDEEKHEIIKQGENGEDMFVILRGEVEVIIDGKVVSELKPGQYFGEMSLIDKSPRSATIKAKGPLKLMRLHRDELFPLLKREPRIGLKIFWAFLQTMNQRLRNNNKLLQNLGPESLFKDWDLHSLD